MSTVKKNFPLDEVQLGSLHLECALRDKSHIIALWMNTIKLLASYSEPMGEPVAEIILLKGNTQRLIFNLMATSFKQYLTVHFPFQVLEKASGGMSFRTGEGVTIDAWLSSNVLAFLADKESGYFSRSALDLAADIEADGKPETLWEVLRYLLIADEGYLRFDDDEENEAPEHPRYHFDIFRTNTSALKVGTSQVLSLAEVTSMVHADNLFGTLNRPR